MFRPRWWERSATTALATALLAGLDRAGVDRSAVTTLNGVGSGMSVAIFDDQGDYGAVIVSGSNLAIRSDQASDELLRSARVLILQNEIPEQINEDVARRAKQLGVTTMLNAAPARAFKTALPDYIDILIVNAIEAEMLGSQSVGSLAEAEAAAEFLASRFAAVVVTAGGDGVAFRDRSGQKISPRVFPSKCKARMAPATCSSEPSRLGFRPGIACRRRSAGRTNRRRSW